jgi:hypothetical protein
VVTAAEKNKPYRPPFWQSRVYGEPYGDFNRAPKPQPVVRVNTAAAGVGGGGAAGGRVGTFHHVGLQSTCYGSIDDSQ